MKRLGVVCFVICLVVAAICTIEKAHAAYLPDDAFMARFAKLLEKAPVQSDGENFFKEVSVGEAFKNNYVAYAVMSSEDGFYLQLDEYRKQKDGSFLIYHWRLMAKKAVHWAILASENNGTLALPITEVPITSEEAITKSEQAQKLLRHFGEQNI
ncbi:MAG: hypothetical protein Q7R73_02765 [bacterium]|nr:hypothetical protein [bacterium]